MKMMRILTTINKYLTLLKYIVEPLYFINVTEKGIEEQDIGSSQSFYRKRGTVLQGSISETEL